MVLLRSPALKWDRNINLFRARSQDIHLYVCSNTLHDHFEFPKTTKRIWFVVHDTPEDDRVKVTLKHPTGYDFLPTLLALDGTPYGNTGSVGILARALLLDRKAIYAELWYQE